MTPTNNRGIFVKNISVGFNTYAVYSRQNGVFTTWHTYSPEGAEVELPDSSRLPTLEELTKIHLGM